MESAAQITSQYGTIILQWAALGTGTVLALFKIRKWIHEADDQQTKRVIKDTLDVHCPAAHSEITAKIAGLETVIKDNSPNGNIDELKDMVEQLLERTG